MEKGKILDIVEKRSEKTTKNMYSRFHYILIGLIAVIVYLIYLIGYYKIQEYETDSFTVSLEKANEAIATRKVEKEFLAGWIRTPAYATLVAKSTQNKQLPGEEVINLVTEEEVAGNADMDTQKVIATIQENESPTAKMTNPEKWLYLIKQGK
jgi:hypothetical protein